MTTLAVQLYSLRSLLDGSLEAFDKVIASVAAQGYQAVETAGLPDADLADVKAVLDNHGISVCSAHIALMTLESDFNNQVSINETLGNSNLIVPFLPLNLRASNADEWKVIGSRIGLVAEATGQAGMQLHYHNHDFEMESFDSVTGLELLADAAGVNDLKVELDLGWVVRGDKDPFELLKRLDGRISHVHVKDIAPAGENTDEDGWADVGHGTIDWKTLLPAAVEAGTEVYIVEHDNPKDPVSTISRGIEFIKSI